MRAKVVTSTPQPPTTTQHRLAVRPTFVAATPTSEGMALVSQPTSQQQQKTEPNRTETNEKETEATKSSTDMITPRICLPVCGVVADAAFGCARGRTLMSVHRRIGTLSTHTLNRGQGWLSHSGCRSHRMAHTHVTN